MAAPRIDTRTRANGDGTEARSDRGLRRILVLACVAGVSVVGSILLISQSTHGVHASPDSFTYLSAATNLARGQGWTYAFGEAGAPITLFPPLYPLLLTLPELLGVQTFDWVLWQNALLLWALSFAVGVTVLEATGGSLVPALLAIPLVQLGTPTTTAYAHIWSEPLFYPIVVIALAALARYLATGRTLWLVIAAASTSAGMLTRYAGLSVFVAACVLLLGWPGQSVLGRSRRTGLFVAIAIPLSGLWVMRNLATSGTLTGDNKLVHSLSGEEVVEGLRTIASWFIPLLPEDGTSWFLLLFAASFVLLLIVFLPSMLRPERLASFRLPPVVAVCSVYALTHFAFIMAANAFSTRSPPFNDRILGSAFAPMVIALVVIGHAMWKAFPGRRVLQAVLLAVGGSLLALSVMASTDTMPLLYASEQGTLPYYRRISRSIERVITPDSVLLSNRANIAWFLTGRPAASLPRSCRGGQILPNPGYDGELRNLAADLGNSPRQVIFFRRSPRCEPFSLNGLRETLRLEHVGPKDEVFVLEGPASQG